MHVYVKQTGREMKNDTWDTYCSWVAALINNSMWSPEEKSVLQVSYSEVKQSKDTISYFSDDSRLSTTVQAWQVINMWKVSSWCRLSIAMWACMSPDSLRWPGLMPAGNTFLHDWLKQVFILSTSGVRPLKLKKVFPETFLSFITSSVTDFNSVSPFQMLFLTMVSLTYCFFFSLRISENHGIWQRCGRPEPQITNAECILRIKPLTRSSGI